MYERPEKCIAEILSGDAKHVDDCFGKGKEGLVGKTSSHRVYAKRINIISKIERERQRYVSVLVKLVRYPLLGFY